MGARTCGFWRLSSARDLARLTEAAEAGLPVEQVKKLGGHFQVAMTQRYMRDRVTDDIMTARAAHRQRKGRTR